MVLKKFAGERSY